MAVLWIAAKIVAGLALLGGLLFFAAIGWFFFSAEPETTTRDIDL